MQTSASCKGPGWAVGEPYTYTFTATGWPTPFFWDDPLPTGVTLAADGTMSGTPTEAGTFSFTIIAENSVGEARRDFTIVVAEQVVPDADGGESAIAATGTDTAGLGEVATLTLVTGALLLLVGHRRRRRGLS